MKSAGGNGRKRPSNPWRRLWHLAGGSFFPVLALFIPGDALLIALGIAAALAVTFEVARLTSPGVKRWAAAHLGTFLKRTEGSRPTGTTYLLVSALVVFIFFEKYTAIAALLYVSVGDLMAQVVGERFGRLRVFNKSLEGSLACLVSCFLIGLAMSWASPTLSLPAATAGAIAATIAELLPIPGNDNLSMPLISGVVMTLTALYFGP